MANRAEIAADVCGVMAAAEGLPAPGAGDWPREAQERAIGAVSVAWCESKGDDKAVNPTPVGQGCSGPGGDKATGRFQIVPSCHPVDGLDGPATGRLYRDGRKNTIRAYEISRGFRDWGQWACKPNPNPSDIQAVQLVLAQGSWTNIRPSDVADVAADVVDAVTDPLDALGGALSFISDQANSARVGLFALGLVLVIGAASLLVADLGGSAALDTAAGNPARP